MERRRQRRREPVDGAGIWPNRRAGHNTSPLQKRCTPRASRGTENAKRKLKERRGEAKNRETEGMVHGMERQMVVIV
jgi:hypothetical protein